METATKVIYTGDIDRGFQRILVDIGERELQALDALSKRGERSRAALIRDAVQDYLARRPTPALSEAFGLWGERKIDGLAFQEKLRGEW